MVRKKSTKGSAVKSAKAKKSAAAKRTPSRSAKPASSGTTGAKSSGAKQESMPLKVRQGCDYRGQDWWGWSVWIEAVDSVLDEIEYVEYSLHPTFPNPVQRVTNREENFLIKSEGWGEFMLGVHIFTRKGEHLKRQHWLTLDYPATPSKKTIASGAGLSKQGSERPTIFLSGGVTELRLANALSEALEQEGFEVVRMEDAPPGVPWDQAIKLLTKQADIMVMLISGELTSWGMREIAAAMDHKLPILPVVIGSLSQLPQELRSFQAIPLKDASDPAAIAPQLAQQIKQSIKH